VQLSGVSVGVGRPVHGVPVHGVKEASAKGVSVGVGRPVHGVKEVSAKSVSVGVGRPVHGVKEANARSENVGAGRPVHGVKEAYAEEGSVDGDDPSMEGSESSDAVWRSSPERDEGLDAFSTPRIPKRGDPTVIPSSPVAPIDAQRALPPPQREMVCPPGSYTRM
jgi:hypothetical protein